MTAPTASTPEEAFRPAFEEIGRRSAVARSMGGSDASETTYFARGGQPCLQPFALPGQDHALVSMGTDVLAPRPVQRERPALRVYGAFASREEAQEHAEAVRALDPTCSLLVVPMREWLLMPQTEQSRDDREYRAARTEKRLASHRAGQHEAACAFETRVRDREETAVPATADREDESDVEEVAEAEALVYKPPRRLRAGAEVRGQSVLAMSVVPDPLVGECLVRLLACFESNADAEAWVRDVGARTITEDDIITAPTCEWLYPNGESRTRTHYRIDELQRIMDAAERNPQAVKDYKTWKAEQDRLKAEEAAAKAIEATDAASDSVVSEAADVPSSSDGPM